MVSTAAARYMVCSKYSCQFHSVCVFICKTLMKLHSLIQQRNWHVSKEVAHEPKFGYIAAMQIFAVE